MSTDPYAPLTSLAAGWTARVDDLLARAERMTNQAENIERNPDGELSWANPEPSTLRVAARHNRAMATALSGAADELTDSIAFARRHVLGEPDGPCQGTCHHCGAAEDEPCEPGCACEVYS